MPVAGLVSRHTQIMSGHCSYEKQTYQCVDMMSGLVCKLFTCPDFHSPPGSNASAFILPGLPGPTYIHSASLRPGPNIYYAVHTHPVVVQAHTNLASPPRADHHPLPALLAFMEARPHSSHFWRASPYPFHVLLFTYSPHFHSPPCSKNKTRIDVKSTLTNLTNPG